jgi:hypothetical protein
MIDSGYPSDGTSVEDGIPVSRLRNLPSRVDADFILLMDVLEHIERDSEFLANVVAASPKGTRFFITVPAFRLLWSKHDEYLGHHRRYRLRDLDSLCRGAGLKVETKFYFFATIFPAVFALRAITSGDGARSDLRPAHPTVNTLLKKLLYFESLWCRANRVLGVSAVVSARS